MTSIANEPFSTYTVREAALQTGVSEHTLRYYERIHLIPHVQRDGSSKHRRYTEVDLRTIAFLKRMRAAGMPISDLQRYVVLHLKGNETMAERLDMLEAHQIRVQDQICELQAHLAVIEFKIENFKRLGTEQGTTDDCLDIRAQSGSKKWPIDNQKESQERE